MYVVVFALGGLIFAPVGWAVAWLAALTYRRFRTSPSIVRVRWIVMGVLALAQFTVIAFDYVDAPARYLPGLLFQCAGYPVGWLTGAAMIEFVLRRIRRIRVRTSDRDDQPRSCA